MLRSVRVSGILSELAISSFLVASFRFSLVVVARFVSSLALFSVAQSRYGRKRDRLPVSRCVIS